ncbi:MAG: hypothetical protein V2J02_06005 [Pseudomonadales bacterium]|jgi:arylesterase/paraoxonase|nr:hypothetical protein [Pseudomonadales bacterium]
MPRLRRLLLLLAAAGAAVLLVLDLRGRVPPAPASASAAGVQCRRIDAPAGPEDLQIDRTSGIAVIAAHDRRRPERQGGLFLLDLNRRADSVRPLPHDGPADFRPHGLSLLRDGAALHALVVNHPAGRHTIELFRIDLDGVARARHLATYAGDALVSPNDVLAVAPGVDGSDRFYVSNDHGARRGWLRPLEDLLALGTDLGFGSVLYSEGRGFRIVVPGRRMANGVALDADGALLVAETLGARVLRYAREPLSGRVDLEAPSRIALGAAPDNLDRAPDGSIWIASHTGLRAFRAHARDPAARSPWVIHRLVEGRVEPVLADDGARLSGASVAAAWDHELLVGAVFEPALLRCTLPQALAPGR